MGGQNTRLSMGFEVIIKVKIKYILLKPLTLTLSPQVGRGDWIDWFFVINKKLERKLYRFFYSKKKVPKRYQVPRYFFNFNSIFSNSLNAYGLITLPLFGRVKFSARKFWEGVKKGTRLLLIFYKFTFWKKSTPSSPLPASGERARVRGFCLKKWKIC